MLRRGEIEISKSCKRPKLQNRPFPSQVFLNDKHPCEICGKIFGFKCELKKHLNTHTGEKTFVWLVNLLQTLSGYML